MSMQKLINLGAIMEWESPAGNIQGIIYYINESREKYSINLRPYWMVKEESYKI